MKVFEGVVTFAQLPKTVTVKVERYFLHPMYGKRMKVTKKFFCHDEKGVKVGDKVMITECRPMSARKRFKIVEVVQEKTVKVKAKAE